MENVKSVYYYFDMLSDNDIENETDNYKEAMDLMKDLILKETGVLRYINIDDTFQSQLVLYNEDDEYILMYKQDYDNDDYTQVITGNKHYVFHWITGFLNSNYSLDEIEILGE